MIVVIKMNTVLRQTPSNYSNSILHHLHDDAINVRMRNSKSLSTELYILYDCSISIYRRYRSQMLL